MTKTKSEILKDQGITEEQLDQITDFILEEAGTYVNKSNKFMGDMDMPNRTKYHYFKVAIETVMGMYLSPLGVDDRKKEFFKMLPEILEFPKPKKQTVN